MRRSPFAQAGLACALASLIGAGCGPKGEALVVVVVTANPSIAGIAKLSGTITDGTASAPVSLDAGIVTLPPSKTFGVVVPLKLGSHVTAHLDAFDQAGTRLGSGDGAADITAGGQATLTVTLSPAANLDGAIPADLLSSDDGSPGDLATADLATADHAIADLAMPDLAGSVFPCTVGRLDCDHNMANGCEIDGASDPAHCGGCDHLCSANHVASPSCAAGKCNGACAAGFDDCDGDKLLTGCETVIDSNPDSCGGCGKICSPSHVAMRTCVAGKCSGPCVAGFADCNADELTDGCELPVDSDPKNCGGCASVCSAAGVVAPICLASMCASQCAPARLDCNNDRATDGCEVDSASDPANCGACGHACPMGTPCTRGVCLICSGQIQLGGAPLLPTVRAQFNTLIADLNGDGLNDLATDDATFLYVFLRNKDGSFAPGVGYPGVNGGLLVAGDVNKDGKLDLVTNNFNPSSILVYLNKGDGSFNPVAAFRDGAAGSGANSVALGDVNGDGQLDAVTANSSDSFTVYLGNGNGVFQVGVLTKSANDTNPNLGVGLADLDGVNGLDVVVANRINNRVYVAFNDGKGNFPGPVVGLTATSQAYWLALRDFDGDKQIDIVATSSGDGFDLFQNLGGGQFGNAQHYAASGNAHGIVADDFDGDKKPDLAVSHNDGTATIIRNKGNGTFLPHVSYIGGVQNTGTLASGDLNGDGKPDLALGANTYAGVGLLYNNGDGTFAATMGIGTQPIVGGSTAGVCAADFNGDGLADFAASNDNNAIGLVRVFLAKGGGAFNLPGSYAADTFANSVAATDLSGDGKPDLVVSIFGLNKVGVFLNKGDGTFPPRTLADADVGPTRVVVVDVNNDKIPDLVSTGNANSVTVDLNVGNGSFLPGITTKVGLTASFNRGIAAADFDGDGKTDVAVVNLMDNRAWILQGLGGGMLGPPSGVPVSPNPQWVITRDFNGDKIADLATANYNMGGPGSVGVLLGKGNGGFAAQASYGAGQGTYAVEAGDLNGDGQLDLVASNQTDGTLSVMLGNANGSFGTQMIYPLGVQPQQVTLADFNGDGKLDVAVMNEGTGVVSVLLNGGPLCQTYK